VSVSCIDPTTDPRWLTLLTARGGCVFHSPPWLNSLVDTYGFRLYAHLVVDDAGHPVAGAPFCRVSDFVGERIASLPFSDYCNPLVRSAAEWEALLREFEASGLPVSFRCLDDRTVSADARLAVVKRARWHGLDVRPDLEILWAGVAASTRRAIRKAEREGVIVRAIDDETLIAEFMRLHVALRKRKYRLLAQPGAFFEALRRRFAAVDGWFPLAACHRDRVVAVTIYLRWKDTLYYKFNASLPEALALRPNDALLWEGIRLARRLGCCRLDLGASDDDQPGLIRFKRHYGAAEREIRFLRYTPPEHAVELERHAGALLARLSQLFTESEVADDVTGCAGAALYRFFA